MHTVFKAVFLRAPSHLDVVMEVGSWWHKFFAILCPWLQIHYYCAALGRMRVKSSLCLQG